MPLRHLTLFGAVSIADEESCSFLLTSRARRQAPSSQRARARMGAGRTLWMCVLIFTGITGVCGNF